MATSDPVLSAIARLGAGSRRSALSRHMRRHFDAIAAEIGEGRADWGAWAAAFNEGGVTVRGGGSVTPNTARVTWQRVKAAVLAQRARRDAAQARRSAPPILAPDAAPHGVRLLGPDAGVVASGPVSPGPRTAASVGDEPAPAVPRPRTVVKIGASRIIEPKGD